MVDKFSKNIFIENIDNDGRETNQIEGLRSSIDSQNNQVLDKKTSKQIKSLSNILSSKKVNLTDLQSAAWSGLPFGKLFLIFF